MNSLIEKGASVPGSVQYPEDLDPLRHRGIEDDIIAQWKTAKLARNVRPFSAEFRHAGQHCAGAADFIKPAAGGARVFLGDVECDFDEVELGPTGSQNNGHQPPFLFEWLRTFSLVPGISNGASSPQSACSIPTPNVFQLEKQQD